MRWLFSAVGVASLVGTALGQVDSAKVTDAETGFTWSSYNNEKGVTFRTAVPDVVKANATYDIVAQIIAPINIGWAGMAWGGSMTYNPLMIVWPNGKDVVVSSRMAYGYYVPPAYDGTVYTVLKKGTHVNATHFQVTAKCTGCSMWGDDDTGITLLEPKGHNPLAFAYSGVPVDDPAKNDSTFSIHDMIGHWIQDFSMGSNPDFPATVSKNA